MNETVGVNCTEELLVSIDQFNSSQQFTNETLGSLITREQILTLILPYSIIFLLAIIGNALVIITLGANRRMRSVTNMFLLNLAVSDLLLGVFCMPFTLVGVLLKEFIFGPLMCSLISYLQAVSVSVSVWTLVVVSVERYYAICRPLESRGSRQTLSHAYKVIAFVWISSLVMMSPIGALSQLKVIENTGKYKCRESWPSDLGFEMFTIFLDVILFVVPLIIMSLTYTMISKTLTKNLQNSQNNGFKNNSIEFRERGQSESRSFKSKEIFNETAVYTDTVSGRHRVMTLRSSASPVVTEARQKRIIKMLFVVVLEFFICWTPIYIVNTITLYSPKFVYKQLGYNVISFFHLLAFFSCCTNPITYGFMNNRFRQSFLMVFRVR